MAMHLIAMWTLGLVEAELPQELEYLGTGYHIILGDPHIVGDRDPGWRADILDRNYLLHQATRRDAIDCSYDARNYEINGAKSAQEALKREWSTKSSVGLFKIFSAAFTASGSVQTMTKDSFKYRRTYFETHAKCLLKTAFLPSLDFHKYNFTADFETAVANIPTDSGKPAAVKWVIEKLIPNFGTHYTFEIASGGSMGIRSWMSQESFESLKQTAKEKGFSLDAAAKGHFWFLNDPSGSGGIQRDQDATEAFQKAVESGGTSTFCIGCTEFLRDDAKEWAEQLKDNLQPIGSRSNSLVAISELLVPLHFPDANASSLAQKKAILEEALEALCDHVEGCTTHPVDRLDVPNRTIQEGSSVRSVQWSPDGATLVSGSFDKMVRVWDAETGTCLKTLTGHSGPVNSVAYSPDGNHIASGSHDNTIKIWDTETGSCLQTLTGHSDYVNSVAYSPDGNHIASGSHDNTIKIWDAETGSCLQTLTGPSDYVYSVTYSPDGNHIASGSVDNTIKIWDAETGSCLQTLTGHSDAVQSVAYSPDGNHIASGSHDNTIKIWDAETGSCLQTLTGHSFSVHSVAYSPDGNHIASGSDDESIKIWDAETGSCLQTLTGHSYAVQSVAYSPDGNHIASGSNDNTIKIWDASSSRMPSVMHGVGHGNVSRIIAAWV